VKMWGPELYWLFKKDPERTTALLQERWTELRKNVLTEEVLSGMAREDLEMLHDSGAYDRNYEKWPNGIEYWNEDYLFEYIEGRLPFLDEYLKDPYLIDEEGAAE